MPRYITPEEKAERKKAVLEYDFDSDESPSDPVGSTALLDYLIARRKTIEASIAAERLAGNEHKEACERTALAEIIALEQRLPELMSS